ncbi:response regulator transcription factor [Massilia sp. Dwa41.01b]|uniref:LytR/AlgR family response regulator transcription factor n=1 Tax=unclassified Massilia TaxID=2609279 RepID=UPI00160456ED|nr:MULTISPECIES: LytTR family DNA-binding domain-containing protein [unclassified Massilia]QNA88110.1 response regulator transcription factor [Massilia sp. Dwa41.01b]QNA99019.1 response regulator transcription factor [Massilia sp. Se16.2.3]
MRVTALIADDEAAMREQLHARLLEAWPDIEVVAVATNGIEAVDLAARYKPQIAFLDIRMPGMGGIEAARQLYNRCHIVFVTAYDQYAVDAFEHGAIDYLLKPVTAERLSTTRERLHRRLTQAPQDIGSQLAQLGQLLQQQGAAPKRNYLRWIQAQVGGNLRMISTREILFFQSDEKYTRVQTATAELLIRKTLKELADELDPDEFWRIHRSTLVRVDAIAEVSRDMRGRQMLRVRNYPQELEVSRNHAHLFQQM